MVPLARGIMNAAIDGRYDTMQALIDASYQGDGGGHHGGGGDPGGGPPDIDLDADSPEASPWSQRYTCGGQSGQFVYIDADLYRCLQQ